MTGESTLAINPFLYMDNDGNVGQDFFIAYGVTNRFDIWSDINVIPELSLVDMSVMVRFDLTGKNTILAVRANGVCVTPQFHYIWENDRVVLQGNLAGQINYDYLNKPAIYAILSPAIKLADGLFDVFCEVNPGYYLQEGDFANLAVRSKGFDLDVVPGIGFSAGKSLFSVSCPIYNIATNPTPTFGAWWFFSITSK